jgi:hypothetical protein
VESCAFPEGQIAALPALGVLLGVLCLPTLDVPQPRNVAVALCEPA